MWEQYAFDPSERARAGVRSREWTAVAQTEVEVIRELARCLRLISQGRVPRSSVRSVLRRTVPARQGRCLRSWRVNQPTGRLDDPPEDIERERLGGAGAKPRPSLIMAGRPNRSWSRVQAKGRTVDPESIAWTPPARPFFEDYGTAVVLALPDGFEL